MGIDRSLDGGDSRKRSLDGRRSRRGFLCAAGVLGSTPIVGCLGRDGEATAEDDVTIEYVEVAGERSAELFEPVIEELEERHEVSIDLEFTGMPYSEMRRQLLTRVGGNNPPDIAAIDQIWMGEFIDSGGLMDLAPVVAEIDFDDYLDAFAAPLTDGEQVYGIPITTDVRGMYWNRDHFAAAGLDPDSPPETWAEFFDVAGDLHDPPDRFGSVYFVVGGRWTVSLFSAGGAVLNADGTVPRFHEEPGQRAAEFLSRIYNEDEVAPADPPYADGAKTARNFLTGEYAMTLVEGSWLDFFAGEVGISEEEMVENFGFGPTPYPEDGSPRTMSGGFAWAGFAGTDNPEIVADFLRIVGDREFKRQLAIETGDIPTRASLMDDADIWDEILYADEIRGMLEHTATRPIRNWSVVANELDPALQEIAFGESEAGPALDRAADAVGDAL